MIRTRLETDGPFTLQEDGSYAGTVILSLTNPSQEEREKKDPAGDLPGPPGRV